jgi:hypothetical protein
MIKRLPPQFKLLFLSVLVITSCSKPINSRVAGWYEVNGRSGGEFYVKENGYCTVTEPFKQNGTGQRAVTGNCEQVGEGAIKFKGSAPSDFGLPDFRNDETILRVEGNALVSRDGTRFIWQRK